MQFKSLVGALLFGTSILSFSAVGQESLCNAPQDRCDSGCYTLGNKINGAVSTPNYGLRLDGLFGASNDHWTFDFEGPNVGVEMCYDGNGGITIQGTAFGGHDIGSQWDPNSTGFIEIEFTYANAYCEETDAGVVLLVDEDDQGIGSGTVTWLNTGEVFQLDAKGNSQGQLFLFDDHNDDPARGWVMWGNGLVGDFAMTITPNDSCPPGDCDGDGILDEQEVDCDTNGIPDDCEPSQDCDSNGIPDRCDLLAGAIDLDNNNVPDRCEPGVRIYCTGGPTEGLPTPCPCGNEVVPGAPEGCASSNGKGASLATEGSVSVAAGDLRLVVTQLPNATPGFFFGGNGVQASGAGTPFFNGIRCIGGPLIRLGKIPVPVNGAASFPPQGAPALNVLLGAGIGDISYAQYWFRDAAGPCGASANMSNGIAITWAP